MKSIYKRLLGLMMIVMVIVLIPTGVMAAEGKRHTNEGYVYEDRKNLQDCWWIENSNQSLTFALKATEMATDKYEVFRYEVPRNGAAVFINFMNNCPRSNQLLQTLGSEGWLDDERINVYMMGSCEVFEVMRLQENFASDYVDKVKWYANAGNAGGHFIDGYVGPQKQYSPAVGIITEEEVVMEDGGKDLRRVGRFVDLNVTDAKIITETLTWLFPDLGLNEKVDIAADEIWTLDVKVTQNYNYAYEVAELVNSTRVQTYNRNEVVLDADLTEVAMKRAAELAVYYNHWRPNGTIFATILEEMGYDDDVNIDKYHNAAHYSENIASGQTSPVQAMDSWMNSEGHRDNITNAGNVKMGVGHAQVGDQIYWVQIFEVRYWEEVTSVPLEKTGSVTHYVPVSSLGYHWNIYAPKNVFIQNSGEHAISFYHETELEQITSTGDMNAVSKYVRTPIRIHGCDTSGMSNIGEIRLDEENQRFILDAVSEGRSSFNITFAKEQKTPFTVNVEYKIPPKHEHVWSSEWREWRAPSCYGTGLNRKYCICGELQFEDIPIRHVEAVRPAEAPTCVQVGWTEETHCTRCFKILIPREEIPRTTTHEYEFFRDERPATCKATGITALYQCKDCGDLEGGKTIPKTSHTEVDVVEKEATCTTAGSKIKKCSVCGAKTSSQSITIPALGHEPGASVEDKAATCTEDGYTNAKNCTRCGKLADAGTVIPALGHQEEIIPGKAATCNSAGTSDGKKCTRCGVVTVKQKTISKLNHDFVMVPAKAATCTEAGYMSHEKCKYCNITTQIRKLSALGHKEKTLPAKAATKTSTDLTQGKQCTVCGVVTVKQKVIPKISGTTQTPVTSVAGIKSVSIAKSVVYTGKALKPKVTVKDTKGKTVSAASYTVIYKNNKKVGKATATVKFRGSYSGSKAVTFKIIPKAPTIKKPVAAKKAVTVKWNKVAKKVTGYEVMVATNKKFTVGKKTVTVKKAKATSAKVTKLKAKKTYYVKVRAYKTVGKVKYYSNWSAVKQVKVK